jgi:hypothetical protein
MVAHLTAHKLDIFDAVSVEVTALQRASATTSYLDVIVTNKYGSVFTMTVFADNGRVAVSVACEIEDETLMRLARDARRQEATR